jgi:hypothetical protein
MPETLGSGYRFKGMPDWNPAGGVHLDASVVKEEPRQAPEAAARSRAEKLADYTEARDEGFTLAEAAELVGIAESTDYQAAARAGGAS